MSPMIRRYAPVLAAVLVLAFAAACSDPRSQVFNSDTGKHDAPNWLPPGHRDSAVADLSVCALCHGQDFLGGISRVSCSACHMGGAVSVHPLGWVRDACFNHGTYAQNNGTAACANASCHGPALAGVAGSGPSCTKCHAMPNPGTCVNCHNPFPPATGSHSVHLNSTVMRTVVCGSCHAIDCAKHGVAPALVAIAPSYYAKSAGTVTFTGTTCSKVSCHGGQTSPSWTGGTIDVATQCTSCHTYGTGEYNGFSSGRHDLHVNRELIGCTQCHDTTLLSANHFMHLETPGMEGPAWQTIRAAIQYNGTTCANPCHDAEQWR